jgi:YVTN family beta-propeller protein
LTAAASTYYHFGRSTRWRRRLAKNQWEASGGMMWRTAALAAAALLAVTDGAGARTIFVSNEKGNSISIVDGDTLELVREVPVGERPRGIALSKDGAQLYICASDISTICFPLDSKLIRIVFLRA